MPDIPGVAQSSDIDRPADENTQPGEFSDDWADATSEIGVADEQPINPPVSALVEIFWPLENRFFRGSVDAVTNGLLHIKYDDGDSETLKMDNENWRFSSAVVVPPPKIASEMQPLLSKMMHFFANRPFMRFEAQ